MSQLAAKATRVLRLVLGLAIILVVCQSGVAQADAMIGFDNLPAGTTLTNQYENVLGPGDGVTFVPLEGHLPVTQSTSFANSPPNVASLESCLCEAFYSETMGTFSHSRDQVGMLVGAIFTHAFSGQGVVTLTGYAPSGARVATATATISTFIAYRPRIETPLVISDPAGRIASFTITTNAALSGVNVVIDNFTFDDPPQAPDFALTATPSALTLPEGSRVQTIVSVRRLGGSNGTITFSASGAPAGVTAAITPLPSGESAMVTLTADAAAPVSPTGSVTITGTPTVPSAGPLPEPVVISLRVIANFSISVAPHIASADCRADIAVTVTRDPTFTGQVSLSLPRIPQSTGFAWSVGVTTVVFPPSIFLQTSTLTLVQGFGLTGGSSFALRITASSPGLPSQHVMTTITPQPCGAPFDLRWTSVDANGLPLNPNWLGWLANHQKPSAEDLCGGITKSAMYPSVPSDISLGPPSYPSCTTQPYGIDDYSFCENPAGWGTRGGDSLFHGHVNWRPATYTGTLRWGEHSSRVMDDDYSIGLITADSAGLTARNGDSILTEFNSHETIDHFHTNWWEGFHNAVDNGHAWEWINGQRAVVTGLLGLDAAHSIGTELHPVYAMAIEESALDLGIDDAWAVFARNWGDEGFCGPDNHLLGANTVSISIPWLPGATGVSLLPSTRFLSHRAATVDFAYNVGNNVTITFTLGPASGEPRVNGDVHLHWIGPWDAHQNWMGSWSGLGLNASISGASVFAGDVASVSNGKGVSHPRRPVKRTGNAENFIPNLSHIMTKAEWRRFRSALSKSPAPLARPDTVNVVPSIEPILPPIPARAPGRDIKRTDPAAAAQASALRAAICHAYLGHPPGPLFVRCGHLR